MASGQSVYTQWTLHSLRPIRIMTRRLQRKRRINRCVALKTQALFPDFLCYGIYCFIFDISFLDFTSWWFNFIDRLLCSCMYCDSDSCDNNTSGCTNQLGIFQRISHPFLPVWISHFILLSDVNGYVILHLLIVVEVSESKEWQLNLTQVFGIKATFIVSRCPLSHRLQEASQTPARYLRATPWKWSLAVSCCGG